MAKRDRMTSGDRTRSLVLDHIRARGQVSRVELAQLSSFDQATISHVVRRLLAENLIEETGLSQSTGGKPRTLLAIKASSRSAVGVSLAHEQLSYVVTDLAGSLVAELITPGTGEADPAAVVHQIADEIHGLLRQTGIDPRTVVGIGVASPGPLDSIMGALRGQQPTARWRDFLLEERLEELTGMRVVLDNDATCAALGEYWTSRQTTPPSVSATVYMADGIGAGVLINGGVFHGTSSNSGEIGHVTLDVNGPLCHCGARGCVEVYATPAAVATKALQDAELTAELGLSSHDTNSRTNFVRIAQAADRRHQRSIELISDAAWHLGSGVVTLSNILDLDEVHLSGPGFADAGEIFLRVVQDCCDRHTFMRSIHPVTVRLSHVGPETAALGAAALILQQEITPHSAVGSRRRSRIGSPVTVAAEPVGSVH